MQIPYVSHSQTSKAAAVSMKGKADLVRTQVLETIRNKSDGMTCDEVEEVTGFRHQTASARICELRYLDLIEATGFKKPTRSGRNAAVYRVRKAA